MNKVNHATVFNLLFVLCSSAHVLIPKCCARDENFNNAIKCVKNRSNVENWDWILSSLVDSRENKTFTNLNTVIQENTSLSCSAESRAFLLQEIDNFELILTKEGHLQLKVQVYSTIDEDQWMKYEGDTFCMDASTRVVLFCPCSRLPCVTKCCMEGYNFNKTPARCIDTGEDESGFWRPDFLEGAADKGYYIIENRQPKCASKKTIVVPTSNITRFNISSDGSVKIPGYKHAIAPGEYCGDTGIFLVCPQKEKYAKHKFIVYGTLLLVAGSLLLASVLVNCCLLPQTVSGKLHNKFLTAHNASLACAYLATAIAQIVQHMTGFICIFAAPVTLATLCTEHNSSWLPAWAQRLNSSTQYVTRIPCEGRHQLLRAEDSESYEILEDGSLLLYQESAANLTLSSSSYCIDNLVLTRKTVIQVLVLCPCDNVTCIKKCCSNNKYLDKNHRCVESENDINWRPSFIGDTPEYFQIFGLPRCSQDRVYLLNPTPQSPMHFWFMEDGRITSHGFRGAVPVEEYCWDTTRDEDGNHIPNVLYCKRWQRESTSTDRRVIYAVMLLIDAMFLIATLFLYMLLPELRGGLHAKYLMGHTTSLLVAYVFLGLGQLKPNPGPTLCIAIAFIIQFAFLAAFFWLNVMCIDIAWAFSGLHPPQGSAVERDHKKLLFYSAYAWGTTGIISIITAMTEFMPGLLASDSPLKPNIGHRACWFEKPAATLAYFYGPMAFLLLGNLVLFLYTAARIISVRRDTAILNSAGNTTCSTAQKDRQRLVLYVKLFCLMGLTWMTEIISWAVGGADYYWYITDIVNMLRAVFIFAIFCCKKSVLHLLRARLASILPCMRKLTRGKSTTSFSGPTSSLRFTTSIKNKVRRPSMET